MNNIQLYIKNTDGDYVPIDIFDNENIQVEDSIQDVKDISKIFNTFTRDFKVPASFENNKLFKHYYNLNIDNGFDGRIKTEALIQVGGVDYKKGFLRLLSVGLKDGKASFYKLTFQGLITSLKDVLEDDELKDLNYSSEEFETKLEFLNTIQSRVTALRGGIYKDGTPEQDDNGDDLYPDMILAGIFTKGKVVPVPYYPAINSSGGYPTYMLPFSLTKFTGIGPDNTLVEDSSPRRHDPVTIDDYKPSIKVGVLLKMIGEQYGLNFSKEFYQMEELDQLYIHYNGKREESTVNNGPDAFNSNLGNNTSLGSSSLTSVFYSTEANPPGDDRALPFDSVSYPAGFDRAVTKSGAAGLAENNFRDVWWSKAYFVLDWNDANSSCPSATFKVQKFYRDDDGNRVILHKGSNYAENWTLPSYQFDSSGYPSVKVEPGMNRGSGVSDFNYYNTDLYYDTIPDGKSVEFGIQITSTGNLDPLRVGVLYGKANWTGNGGQIINTFTPTTTSQIQYANVLTSDFMNISIIAPKLKLVDMLLGIFKMLNLTAYIEDDVVKVLPVRDFYAAGDTLDITPYVDVDSHTVENGFVYRNVTMKHQEPEDVLTKNFVGSQVGVEFGDIKVSKESFLNDADIGSTTDVADGKDYNIESPFARMMFENLAMAVTEATNSSLSGRYDSSVGGRPTDMVIGNCIDDTLEGIETKPIIFYGKRVEGGRYYNTGTPNPTSITDLGGRQVMGVVNHGNTAGRHQMLYYLVEEGATSTNSNKLVSDNLLTDENNVTIGNQGFHNFWNPSGMMASRHRRDGTTFMNPYELFNSISFDGSQAYDELEYYNGLSSDRYVVGLYQNNYEDYLKNLYAKNSRISKFKIHFPPSMINKYRLNDTVIIGTNSYNINNIKINLLTGKGEIVLINKLDIPTV